MRVYYNEWDEPTAAWLQSLGDGRHLPSGHVDTRSIRDVHPDDLRGYDQCHFFAGIGGWPLALRLAGYEHLPCWTGSPPCQPFSAAGQQRGTADERHLAPVWLDLVREFLPPSLFGEQVADAIRHGWLDDLFNALEEYGYACGAAVLPACSVGAPHIRKRLFFGAVRLEHANLQHFQAAGNKARSENFSGPGQDGRLANTNKNRCKQGREVRPVCAEHDAQHGGPESRLADPDNAGPQRRPGVPQCADQQPARARGLASGSANSDHGGWESADWLGCRDSKFRPVEPGTQPLANGIPARVGRLRGYGNAIVPQVAAAFIQDFIGAALKGPAS